MFVSTSEKNIGLRIFIDAIILIIAAAVESIFYIGILTPFRRGYFCDDDSIKYPSRSVTVEDWMLYTFSCFFGFIVIVLSEFFSIEGKTHQVYFFKWNIPRLLLNIYTSTYVFLFGTIITDISTNFIKYQLGRLRPHFLDVCQSSFNCTVDPQRYVEDYICLNPDISIVEEARLSFPSGHASIVVFTMTFSMVYLQKRLVCFHSKLLKPVIQMLLFLWASFTALSRIEDNKHHATDVVGGAILGLLICYAMYSIQPNCFESSQSTDQEMEENRVSFNMVSGRLSSFANQNSRAYGATR